MIEFSFPAYAPEPKMTLRLQAQALGDTDIPAVTIKTLYTMDSKVITRRRTPRKKVSSTWHFKGVFDIYNVRRFFEAAEGDYIKYKHYDGSEWVIVVNAKAFPVETDGLRAFEEVNGERQSAETYMFSLAVDRWPLV